MSNFQPRLEIGQIKEVEIHSYQVGQPGNTTRQFADGKGLKNLSGKPCLCAQCNEKGLVGLFVPGLTWNHDGGRQWSGSIVCEICGRELPATRFTTFSPDIKLFGRESDMETGLTWWVFVARVSSDDWKAVSHLFEREVELDCPEGREWNESITLPYATRKPEQVEEILAARHGVEL